MKKIYPILFFKKLNLLLPIIFLVNGWIHSTAQSNPKKLQAAQTENRNPAPFALCSELGVESGNWGSWKASEGYFRNGDPAPTFFSPINPASSSARFSIVTGTGNDPCTVGAGGPPLPFVCPGFGNSSIRLGEAGANGISGPCYNTPPYPSPPFGIEGNGCSERLEFNLTVTKQDTNFVYAYALVIENPPSGHSLDEAPFAEIYILDSNNDTIDCSHRKYIADLTGGVGAGFYTASCAGSTNTTIPNGMIVSYKPWTLEGINLSKYVGQTLKVVITNTDCAKSGHYCYSYWDFSCGVFTTNPASYCIGQPVSISAPTDGFISYNYQWYQNGVPYTEAPSGTSQIIYPNPQPGDTFFVNVMQPSNCNFKVVYVPTPMGITPSFTSTGTCGTFNFYGSATTIPALTPVTSWNWSFPGGSPTTSTSQNPTGITYTATGTYSVTLVTTSQGCSNSITIPITVTDPPLAAFSSTIVCPGIPVQFTDNSVGDANDPISSYNWIFTGGNPASSASQNPLVTYPVGNFTATLTVTSQNGCTSTITHPVVVNPSPVANIGGNNVCFNEQTVFTDLSVGNNTITQWEWNFGDGNTSGSSTSPTHTYGSIGTYTVTLIVTNNSGCKDTASINVTVHPLPIANFSSTVVCFGNPTAFSNLSTIASGTITGWNWIFGDGSPNSSSATPTHIYGTSGNFTATLIITSADGCRDTVTNPVTVYGTPVANYTDPAQGCAPVCTTFTDISVAPAGELIASWEWTTTGGSPATSNAQNPTFCWTLPGSYDVQLIVTSNHGCRDTLSTPQYVNVYAWPTADFCVTPSIAPSTEPVFVFCDLWSSNVSQWAWDFGDGSPIDNLNTDPIHSYASAANGNDFYSFNICVRVQTQYGCLDTACRVVEVLPEFMFYIPNTFTPNKDGLDGINDVFFGKSRGVKEYNIWLFDRWGNLIWDCEYKGKSTDWDGPLQDGMSSFCKWDGKVEEGGADMNGSRNERAQEEVYVWKVKLTDIFDKKHTYIGHVNIIR